MDFQYKDKVLTDKLVPETHLKMGPKTQAIVEFYKAPNWNNTQVKIFIGNLMVPK